MSHESRWQDERVLRAIDKATTRTRSRSRLIEDAVREYLARHNRAAREARDLAILNEVAEDLCEALVSLPKPLLTDHVATLKLAQVRALDQALRVALALA